VFGGIGILILALIFTVFLVTIFLPEEKQDNRK